MISLMNSIYFIFPLISLALLAYGFKSSHKNYISLALWLSLLAVLLEYQTAGGEILGSYFNYKHAAIYSLNLLVLMICIIYLLFYSFSQSKNSLYRYASGFTAAIAVTGAAILITNLWVNAFFIEHRLQNTPLLQVASFQQVEYCSYSYVFYKINPHGQVQYMCPNYYGLLPSVGNLKVPPAHVLKQLPPQLQTKFSHTDAKQETQ
ncbi:type I secretion system LssZ [Legionella birminghamensis]|uniref:Type I secretion system LssZ n=1 Tax=Legionella birminghamensis TaxID=28083 RepID=A0A378IAL1_9GAMM|nr:type I secretion system protein LssZ [Legionella birminghamensis]KTC75227.1 type I secretion system LssZ [Legionella birminghamensis]STX31822.1 type I secretion system LssZ [Legionella birminghamensis]